MGRPFVKRSYKFVDQISKWGSILKNGKIHFFKFWKDKKKKQPSKQNQDSTNYDSYFQSCVTFSHCLEYCMEMSNYVILNLDIFM